MSFPAFCKYLPTVILDYAVTYCKSQASAFAHGLCREERIEYLVPYSVVDADAVVHDQKLYAN